MEAPKKDYISHHFPVNRYLDTDAVKSSDSKQNDLIHFTTTPNPKSSKPMNLSRKIAAGLITVAHIFTLYMVYDLIFNVGGWLGFKWFAATYILYVVTGTMGITAGVHRLWSHRSYKANLPARLILGLANTIANQGSIIHWSAEHRVHHIHVDTDADPHNIRRGFFFAHMGWLFAPRTDAFVAARKTVDLSDLYADPVAYYQNKYYAYLSILCCYVLPTIVGYYFTGEVLRSFTCLAMARWVITLHVTWNVNSVAHLFGDRPYDPKAEAREIRLVSIFSGGEGWHNYHHAVPWDYAATEDALDLTWRFNLARFWIDMFAVIGWTYDRKIQRNVKRYPLENPEESSVPTH